MNERASPLIVNILAIPDAVISTMSGVFDVMNSFEMLRGLDDAIPQSPPFSVRIVSETAEPVELASGFPIKPDSSIKDAALSDIIIVPSVLLIGDEWRTGRYPAAVEWLAEQHENGAVLCSACSGIFLLAETGLFDGRKSTIHWQYRHAFQRVFPDVLLDPEKVLIVAGEREELITSGASNSWHDLVLYLVARHCGPPVAQSVAKFFALQWHRDGMAPYMHFNTRRDHGDSAIADVQSWIDDHYSVINPVEEMVKMSGLTERTFNRRFTSAISLTPIAYVQRIRVDEAKKRLERTKDSIETISWQVGYEDPSAFRRLFGKVVGISPAKYRRKFQVPNYSKSS